VNLEKTNTMKIRFEIITDLLYHISYEEHLFRFAREQLDEYRSP
jgi:hypothetical protein